MAASETASRMSAAPCSMILALALSTLLALGSGCGSWAVLFLVVAAAKLLISRFVGHRMSQALREPSLQHSQCAQHRAEVEGAYEDPLRWSFLPSNGVHRANSRQTQFFENDLCSAHCVAMHRPTHEPGREATGDYPYSWHLAGRKRLWEIRVQLRFKKVPTSKLYFGIELSDTEAASSSARQMKALLVRGVQSVVGEFYYSDGEEPVEGQEVEPPTFVMPLWAFDQFDVSEEGQEPDITGDMENIGKRRTSGLKAYVQDLKECIDNFSTGKVYTFSIWGVSQFLDCMRWEARGVIPGMSWNFSRFGLRPPLNIAIYEIPESHPDCRHLISRKRYYLSVAMWSMLQPPEQGKLRDLLGQHADSPKGSASPKRRRFPLSAMDVFACCTGQTGLSRDLKHSGWDPPGVPWTVQGG
eukprot:TRINITY_DN95854_c0_g1_i1.p1 TRINITY_DN95854_c0_g1~~TRINITY_DN95854_c0_g1_i1.p1  ORF type:complete len:425 (-),score=79.33 TRINITY_DN95854_c0_g1_i1:26-1264(-)